MNRSEDFLAAWDRADADTETPHGSVLTASGQLDADGPPQARHWFLALEMVYFFNGFVQMRLGTARHARRVVEHCLLQWAGEAPAGLPDDDDDEDSDDSGERGDSTHCAPDALIAASCRIVDLARGALLGHVPEERGAVDDPDEEVMTQLREDLSAMKPRRGRRHARSTLADDVATLCLFWGVLRAQEARPSMPPSRAMQAIVEARTALRAALVCAEHCTRDTYVTPFAQFELAVLVSGAQREELLQAAQNYKVRLGT